MKHTLSIIICTKDREQSLKDCLESLFCQMRRPDEIVVVDDGNLDGNTLVAWIERQRISCRYLKKDTPGLTASRNLGVAHAHGDIFLFLDDDVLLGADYVAGIMDIYEADAEHEVGGVTGALQVDYRPGILPFLRFFGLDGRRPGAILPSGYGVLVREGKITRPIEVQWLSGCNMSYRREVFDEFRFDQRLGAYGWSEDRDFSFRVSHRYILIATPRAKLVHLEEPGGRIDTRCFGFMETNYLYRFFEKNMPKRLINWLALAWAMVGVMCRNLLLMVTISDHRGILAKLRGNLEGLWAIRTGRDFIP